jgi:hypothetical protein
MIRSAYSARLRRTIDLDRFPAVGLGSAPDADSRAALSDW